ncbi:MAG: hypothetical protein AAB320_08010 [Elusimicrobiota bacterium]
MPPETDNLRLQELFQADQQDRQRVYESGDSVRELAQRDGMRRTVVSQMIQNGEVGTVNDLYHAAVIFQHGSDPKDFLSAHRLAAIAAINGHRPSRWLTAAALDRFLMAMGLPQVYGTQFEHNAEDNKYQLRLPIDDAGLLPFEKKFFNVPAVIDRLTQLNGKIKT